MELSTLKSSYELACERIIAPKFPKINEETEGASREFIKIPEFECKEDVTVQVVGYNDGDKYAPETKLIERPEEEREKQKKKEESMETIKVQESETINYGDVIECHYCGSAKNYSGYSKMNRNFIFGLSNRNVKVKVEDCSINIEVNDETNKQITFLQNMDVSPTAPKIYSMTVPSDFVHPGKKIAYTMIETSSLHKDYCEKLNMMDELWVPSNFGKQLLQKSNVCTPSYVMPLGVDTNRYKPDCGTMDFGSAMRDFKFLCLSKYSSRKGFDILFRAYMEEFSGDEDVSLLLVTRPLDVSADRKGMLGLMEDFNGIKQSIKKSEDNLPHIAVYNKPLQEKDMPKVYNSCNAFVLISRGEGFSLTPLEAASCGLPVIASNVTAHTDFLKEDNSYLVDPDNFIEAKVGGNMSSMAKLCHFYEGQLFPNFGHNALQRTKEHMRYIFENYSKAKEKAEKLRKLVNSNYTWNMAIDKVYNRLRDIS